MNKKPKLCDVGLLMGREAFNAYVINTGETILTTDQLYNNSMTGCFACQESDNIVVIFMKNGCICRDDAPSKIYPNSYEYCVSNNHEWHRIDGPAHVWLDGDEVKQSYWIDDQPHTEEQYWNHPLVIQHKLKQIVNL